MIPHPSTIGTVAESRRQDLLAVAARERLAATAPDRSPRVPVLPTLWRLVAPAVRMMLSGLNLQPRPRAWTHA